MNIGVISDSHGYEENISMALKKMGDIDVLIFSGDGYKDLEGLEQLKSIKVLAVKGNCDEGSHEEEIVTELDGKKFYIIHGHQYGVKLGLTRLFYRAKELGADYVIYGHSHNADIFVHEGITLINPGSVSIPREGKDKSCAVIYSDKSIEIIYFN